MSSAPSVHRLATPVSADAEFGIVDGPPSTGWVVHEVNSVAPNTGVIWAWCKVDVSEPGYGEITFTTDDGKTPANHGDHPLQLGRVIVKVWC